MSLVVSGPGITGPLVRSKADPAPNALRALRTLLQRRPELRELFVHFKAESQPVEWLRDMLTARVAVDLDELSFEEVVDVCQYVADEYQQLACVPGCQLDDGWYVLDQETGRTVAVAGPGDIYRPGLLPRQFGGSGEALPQLDPALEARLTTGLHERARERESLTWLAERARQTGLVLEPEDRRLRVASREGRTSIARELSEENPERLMFGAGGPARLFLRHLTPGTSARAGLTEIDGVATASSVFGIQDARAINLAYDPLSVLRATAGNSWVRGVVRQLSWVAKESARPALPINGEDIDDELFASAESWVTDPDTYVLLSAAARHRAFPVEGAETIGFSGCIGKLVVGRDLGVQTRELLDRWEVTATVPYKLYVDLSKVQVLPLVGVARAAEPT